MPATEALLSDAPPNLSVTDPMTRFSAPASRPLSRAAIPPAPRPATLAATGTALLALVTAAAAPAPVSLTALALTTLALTTQATPAAAQSARAERDPAAEAFVLSEANKVLAVLGDRSMSVEAKKKTFRALIDEVADVPKITGYVLGKYRRSLTDAQFRDFSVAFREFANTVYESRLGAYKGETLRVTNSIIRKPGDVVVTSEVVGGQTRQPLKVLWRVLKGDDGRWRAVDVQVEGVWLAVTEQQDFVSTLDNAHGDINVLIAQLKGEKKDAIKPH
jgi:phospholipid transport system substrate-binding protein